MRRAIFYLLALHSHWLCGLVLWLFHANKSLLLRLFLFTTWCRQQIDPGATNERDASLERSVRHWIDTHDQRIRN